MKSLGSLGNMKISRDRADYLAIFAIALSIRMLPEILSWPYLIGWDTPEYVANLKDFVLKPNPLERSVWYGGYRLLPPLLDILLYPFTFMLDPWYIYKIVPSLIYGFEAMAFYFFTNSLGLDRRERYFSTLTFIFYPASLRFSWDLHRNSLGLIFLILLLAEVVRNEPWGILVSSLGAYLSNEFTFVLAFMLVGASFLEDLREGRRSFPKIIALILGIGVLLILSSTIGISKAVGWRMVDANYLINAAYSKTMFIAILYAPLLLLLPMGLKKMKNRYLLLFLIMTAFFALSDLIVPGMRFACWDRWVYHLVIPLSLYSGVAVSGTRLRTPYLALIAALGLAFATLPYQPPAGSLVSAGTTQTGHPSNISHPYRAYPSLTDVLNWIRGIGRTTMTYTMMHSSVPIPMERYYVEAAVYLSNKRFSMVVVDWEGYGFVHMWRRFDPNIIGMKLSINWKIPKYILERVKEGGSNEFYVLGYRGMRISCCGTSSCARTSIVKEFKKLVLYRCLLNVEHGR